MKKRYCHQTQNVHHLDSIVRIIFIVIIIHILSPLQNVKKSVVGGIKGEIVLVRVRKIIQAQIWDQYHYWFGVDE